MEFLKHYYKHILKIRVGIMHLELHSFLLKVLKIEIKSSFIELEDYVNYFEASSIDMKNYKPHQN